MKPFERLKDYRKSVLKISQDEFARRICMSRANIANIEVGRIDLTDRTIQQVCAEFGVSERWLRTGEGEMYTQTDRSLIDQVCKTYSLDGAGRTLLETLLALPAGYAQVLLDVAHRLVEHSDSAPQSASEIDINAEVESYRQELETEAKVTAKSSASPDTTVKDA